MNSSIGGPFPKVADPSKFLQKAETVEFNVMRENVFRDKYEVVYHKDPSTEHIWIEKISSSNPRENKKLGELKDKVISFKELQALSQVEDSAGKVANAILRNESKIVLGLTDIGELDQYNRYKMVTKNNIDAFSDSLKAENYQHWGELENWNKGDVDWKDVIDPRLKLIQDSPFGEIHFNLTGMNKADIQKSLQLEYQVATGETEKTWGGKFIAPTKSWKEAFGLFGLTYWELMQVVRNPLLLSKTKFYLYDTARSAKPFELTPAVLKADYGLDLDKIVKDLKL
jgi:hypothetical protein